MDKRAFAGLMIIETLLAFANTFASSFNMIYLFKKLELELWLGPAYLLIGFGMSVVVCLWMSWKPRLDPGKTAIVGLGFLVVEYVSFILIPDPYILSVVVGFAFGIFYSLFWNSFNVMMAQMTAKTDRGVTYGAFFFVWPLATFIAPLLGGLVIENVNYKMLFSVGIALVIVTAITIYAYRDYVPKNQAMKIRLRAIGRRNIVAVLGEGGFEGIFWIDVVLVAYIFSTDEVELGALFSLFGLSAGIMAIIFGKISDKIQNRRMFSTASALASIPCIVLIYFSDSLESYGFANGLLEFASFVFPVFIFAILTDKMEDAKNDSVLTRELLLDIGRVSTISVMMLLLYLGFTPQECFLIAIPFLVLGALAKEEKKSVISLPVGAGHSDQLH
jgi:MFS family permease